MNITKQICLFTRTILLTALLLLAFTAGAYAQNAKLGKIAILPFTGGSPDEGDGIAEMISYTDDIANNFLVIPRTGIIKAAQQEQAFQARSGMTDADTISKLGNQLGADYVMAGSITTLGNKHLLIVSIIKIDVIRQVAGDYLVYDTLDALNEDRTRVDNMGRNLVKMGRDASGKPEKLALLPVEFTDGTNKQEGDTLAQLLAIYLLRAGKYAVYPRTKNLEQVQSEYSTQLRGGVTRTSEAVKAGGGENPPLALSVISRKIGSGTTFNAGIIALEDGTQIAGKTEEYASLSDGMEAMDFLARELSGRKVSAAERKRRMSTIDSEKRTGERTAAAEKAAAAAEEKAREREARAREAALNRAAAADKFLENAGIAFGGWGGFNLGGTGRGAEYTTHSTDKETGKEKTGTSRHGSGSGGGSFELRLNRYFAIQTGINALGGYAPYTPPGEKEQYKDLTTLQIPILARLNLQLDFNGSWMSGFQLGLFGGVGVNVFSNVSDNVPVDPARVSIIAGAEGRVLFGQYFEFLLLGYQWNGDIGNSSITVNGTSYNYYRNHHTLYFGAIVHLPFRKRY